MNKPFKKKEINRIPVKEIYLRNRRFTALMFFLGFFIGICFLFFDLPIKPVMNHPKSGLITDPLDLLWQMRRGEYDKFVLVDTRSKEDFLKAHIKSAISFPLFDQGGRPKLIDDALLSEFEEQFKEKKNTIVIYGNSGRSVRENEFASKLNSKNVKVTVLSIGWNEWRHFRNLWLPESLWDSVQIDDYVSQ